MEFPVAPLDDAWVGPHLKAIPSGMDPFPLSEVGRQGWNVLREDLPFPLAVLRASALRHNSLVMRRFLARTGAFLVPHGKTTMSPQLFHRQLDDGAIGITVATVGQLRVCRDHGIERVVLANQLLDRAEIAYVLGEMRRDAGFDFYCLVDSVEGVRRLAEVAAAEPPTRPLQVFVEGGFAGGRAGVRSLERALEVARAVHGAAPRLALRGVEGFEGLIDGPSDAEAERRVSDYLGFLAAIARAAAAENLFAEGPVILTAGGSAFHDLAAQGLDAHGLPGEVDVWLRSGCYLTHDSGMYDRHTERLLERSPGHDEPGERPRAALEVWARVQSCPEPGRAILTLGKRDCSFDAGLPTPLVLFRPGVDAKPTPVPEGFGVRALNDQHAFLDHPREVALEVGDLLGLGVSHPCTTFDRWQLLMVVDDAYDVIGGVRTFFG